MDAFCVYLYDNGGDDNKIIITNKIIIIITIIKIRLYLDVICMV